MSLGIVAAVAGIASAGVGIASQAGAFTPDQPDPAPPQAGRTATGQQAIAGQVPFNVNDFFNGAANLVLASRIPEAAFINASQPQTVRVYGNQPAVASRPAAASPLDFLKTVDRKTALLIGGGLLAVAFIATRD